MSKSAWAVFVGLLLAAPAAALEPGDLLVGAEASLFVVDPDTGAIELLSPDPGFGAPSTISGVAATPGGGEIFISLASSLPGGSVWRVDPESGARTPIAELAPGRSPGGIAIDAGGGLLVPHAFGVSRIDPRSGMESVFGVMPPGATPTGIAIEERGDLLVATYEPAAGRFGTLSRVLRIAPGAAGFADVAGMGGGVYAGIALEADGNILVPLTPTFSGTAPPPPPAVQRIDPQSGAHEFVSTFGLIGSSTDLAVETSGTIALTSALSKAGTGAIARIDPQDGSQTLLVEAAALYGASAIAVVLPEVAIRIRPRHIALLGRSTLSVVLFGSEDLDVTRLDPANLAFGPGGAAPLRSRRYGRGVDDFPDLLLQFRAAEAGLHPADTQACLSGETADFAFAACDEIRVMDR